MSDPVIGQTEGHSNHYPRVLMTISVILLGFPSGLTLLLSSTVSLMILGLRILLLLFFVFKYYIRRAIRPSVLFYLVFALSSVLLFSSILNQADIMRAIKVIAWMMYAVIWADVAFSTDYYRSIHLFSTWGCIILFANFLCSLMFPKGIFSGGDDYSGLYQTTYSLLGNINNMEVFWIPVLAFWTLDSLHGKHGKRKNYFFIRCLLLFVFILIPSVIFKCETGVVLISLWFAYTVWNVYFKQKINIRISILGIVVGFVIAFIIIYRYGAVILPSVFGRYTISSRLLLWGNALSMISQKLIFGYGIGENDYIIFFNQWRNYSPHNQFLMLTLWGGLAALTVFLIIFIYSGKNAVGNREYDYSFLKFTFILIIIYYMVEITVDMSIPIALLSGMYYYRKH